MSELNVDTINEQTSANGVTIDGVKLKDNALLTDTISEKTSASGVTIDGLLIKDGAIPSISGGKILQVVQTTEDTAYSNSGSSYTSVLSTSITPSATTSKVLILVSAHFSMSTDTYGGATLLRGGTEISKSDETTGGGNANQYTVPINNRSGDAQWEARTISINFLDTPSTTSATTYALGFRKDYGSQLMYNRPNATNNAAYHWNVTSHMTLLEVGA